MKITKKSILISSIIILSVLSIFIFLKQSNLGEIIAGNVPLDTQNIKSETGDIYSEDTTTTISSTDETISFGVKDIEINTDIRLQEYEITVSNSDMEIEANELILASPEMEISIFLDTPMQLKEFRGKILWEDSKLSLQGELFEYLSDKIKINWKDSENLELKIKEGNIKINDIYIEEISGVASGTIELGDIANFDLDKDVIEIGEYKGSFESNTKDDTNTLILKGRINEFKIKTEDFGMDIS